MKLFHGGCREDLCRKSNWRFRSVCVGFTGFMVPSPILVNACDALNPNRQPFWIVHYSSIHRSPTISDFTSVISNNGATCSEKPARFAMLRSLVRWAPYLKPRVKGGVIPFHQRIRKDGACGVAFSRPSFRFFLVPIVGTEGMINYKYEWESQQAPFPSIPCV